MAKWHTGSEIMATAASMDDGKELSKDSHE